MKWQTSLLCTTAFKPLPLNSSPSLQSNLVRGSLPSRLTRNVFIPRRLGSWHELYWPVWAQLNKCLTSYRRKLLVHSHVTPNLLTVTTGVAESSLRPSSLRHRRKSPLLHVAQLKRVRERGAKNSPSQRSQSWWGPPWAPPHRARSTGIASNCNHADGGLRVLRFSGENGLMFGWF